MSLSAKMEYACIAMLDLAVMYDSGSPVQQRRMAERHGISAQFLVQILQQLKTAELVVSIRGAAGGYRLARSPETINLWDVVSAVSGETERTAFGHRASIAAELLKEAWIEVEEAQRSILRLRTLASLAQQVQKNDEPMYYI